MRETQTCPNTDEANIIVLTNRRDGVVDVMKDTRESSTIRQQSRESSKHNSCISISNLPVPKCTKNILSWIRAIAIVAVLKNLIKFGIYIYDIVSKCNFKYIFLYFKIINISNIVLRKLKNIHFF